MPQKQLYEKFISILTGWFMIGMHFLFFSQLLPNAQGKLGHDYSYDLPLLLDGYYWFLNNGLFSAPWFSPSFCGGVPVLANPPTFYFSAAQFLTFIFDPLTAVRLTFLLFAVLGYWGFYLLLTRVFDLKWEMATLGAAIFLFNGLYAYRFIIGHLEFHSFMLVPLLAYFLLRAPGPEVGIDKLAETVTVVISGGLIAYMFMSGMTQLLIPSLVAVLILALMKALESDYNITLYRFFLRFILAGILSLLLVGTKLVAALAFLGNFQRDSYLLPGVAGVWRLFSLLFRVLATGGAGIDAGDIISNIQWGLGRHEFEYGVSIVPFLMIIAGLLLAPGRIVQLWRRPLRFQRLVCLAGAVFLLSVPLLLNYYSPSWNRFLKTVPLIKSLSNFFRWFNIYIPFLALWASVSLAYSGLRRKYHLPVMVIGLAILLGQNFFTDRHYYQSGEHEYDPAPIQQAYEKTRRQAKPPVIRNLVVPLNLMGEPELSISRNNALIEGNSQLFCYEPMFGFRLEYFPFKNIHPGPVLDRNDGFLNLKNPSCYLYPRENSCKPGDHFRVGQLEEANKFISFQPFSFRVSKVQSMANWVSLATMICMVSVLLLYFSVLLIRRLDLRRER